MENKTVKLECKSSDNKVFECILKDSNESIESNESEEFELDYFGKTKQKDSSKLIMGIFLSTLIGGFGFAIAYLLLYELYDWITLGDAYDKEIWRFVVAMVVLIGILFLIILITYFIIKKKSNPDSKASPSEVRK
jgi:di/tricarboxylate transporter